MKIAFIIISAFFVIAAIIAGTYVYRYNMAKVEGIVSAQEQIQSKDTRITAYNHFFDMNVAIEATTEKIRIQKELLAKTTDSDEIQRINVVISSLENKRAELVAQYNGDAQKDYTIGQFRSWKLPYQVK